MNNKIDFFNNKVAALTAKISSLQSKYNAYSIYRILIFIAFLVIAILTIKAGLGFWLFVEIVSFVFAFGLIVNRHNKIKSAKVLNEKLHEINSEEIWRLQYNFKGLNGGEEFIDEHHSYGVDLDIFGRNSLFQLINRAGTSRGIKLIASWLKHPADKDAIEVRHKAVSELTSMLDWRQKIQAFGRNKTDKKENEEVFYTWLSGKDFIRDNPFYKILPYLVIVFSSILLIGYLLEMIGFYAFLLPFIITGYFVFKIKDYSKATFEMTQTGVRILESIENIISQIENAEFKDNYLSTLRSSLMPQNIVASAKIKNLKTIFDWLSQRYNYMYHIFNYLFLLDFILLARAEKWRANYKDEVSNWFDAIAEFESLNSIAAFAFANEKNNYPAITDKPFIFQGKEIGHPLIPTNSRVYNDFSLGKRGTTCIVTGSNMAGKSTFLRTIGLNMVLAYAGAPVCAASLQLSYFHVFTSMRTKDNLEENVSSFYAELLRLKMLLEYINENNTVFYLLDEILKGTNSVDRHIGAESLIMQLNQLNTLGLISTHDLKLGELDKKNNSIVNYNFSSKIKDDEIIFDYKLRKGICQSTNASQMMAKIGIKISK